ncbi:MAG TPA: hypothetical protein VNN17_01440 [Terriglobia bacterium]|nr:hypothetical protein [Terriglobia bacterium]
MARRKRTSVVAQIPSTVELTKLKSKNALQIEIRRGEELLGTLSMGRGSVEWWPRGNKVNFLRKRWRAFADMLDKHMK